MERKILPSERGSKLMADEELELEEEEEETETEENKPTKGEKLTLNFDMDPSERLRQEIDFSNDANEKAIGEFLLKEFEKDNVLKADYRDKKVELNKILAFVINEARKRAESQKNRSCVMMSDQEVFGLVIHYVHDGAPKESKKEKYTLTKEEKKSLEQQAREEYLAEQKRKLADEEQKRLEKEKAAREKARAKEKKALEDSGQMTLFDLFGDEDESGN